MQQFFSKANPYLFSKWTSNTLQQKHIWNNIIKMLNKFKIYRNKWWNSAFWVFFCGNISLPSISIETFFSGINRSYILRTRVVLLDSFHFITFLVIPYIRTLWTFGWEQNRLKLIRSENIQLHFENDHFKRSAVSAWTVVCIWVNSLYEFISIKKRFS